MNDQLARPRFDVEKRHRLPIEIRIHNHFTFSARIGQWLEENLVIRNNAHLNRLHIEVGVNDLYFELVSRVQPRSQDERNAPVDAEGNIELLSREHLYLPSILESVETTSPDFKSTCNRVIYTVRELIRSHMMHELDECILVEGKLPFDPHHGMFSSPRLL